MEQQKHSSGLLKRLSLELRLMLFNGTLATLGSLTLSIVFLMIAKNGVTTNIETQLERLRDSRKDTITKYFHSKETDLVAIGISPENKNIYREFLAAYKALKAQTGSSKGAEEYLQKYYVTENPNPVGSKHLFDGANDGSAYTQVHKKYHSFFRDLIRLKRFYDFFYVDMEGNIIYTVFKELDYATNLESGKYKDTNIGKLYRQTKVLDDISKVQFVDFEPYPPSNNDAASFFAIPVVIQGKTEGVLMVQLPIDEINDATKVKSLGDSGVVFLLGNDFKMRTQDHRTPEENTILKRKVQYKSAQQAISGGSGIDILTDARGKEIFSAYSPMPLLGQSYAILAEVDYDEALTSLHYIRLRVILVAVLTIVVFLVSTFFLSKSISKPVVKAVNMLSSSTREIAATVEQQEKTANVQLASVNETTTTMAELGSSSRNSAEQTTHSAELAKSAQDNAAKGAQSIEEMMESMDQLKVKVSDIADQILSLSEKNNQIGNIINLVSDLANQTNMLALNAAVEAARAGEYGKGFAVVAVEIRKLADESKKSAERIQDIISEIKKATDSSVMATEEGTKRVEKSVNYGKDAYEAFQGVLESINGVFVSTEQISMNVKQQSIAVNEVVQAMNTLSRGSQETASGIGQTKVGIRQLDEATQSLKDVVSGLNE